MKALSKSIMATIVLAAITTTAWAENVGDTQTTALSGSQAVAGAALLIFLLVLPTTKSSNKY